MIFNIEGKQISRHLLAGLICAGISCLAMSALIIVMLSLGVSRGILIHPFPVANVINVVPRGGERILIMAFWISVGLSMAGTFIGFGRGHYTRVHGYFPSLLLAALAGFVFSIVLYGLFSFLHLPFYNGEPSSVWLPLGIGVLFGAIGWGNFVGWLSTRMKRNENGD